MTALFFLWVHPKNAGLMATQFQMCSQHHNVDKTPMSKKLGRSACKCEVVLALDESKVLSVGGPVKALVHDMTLFCKEKKVKIENARKAMDGRLNSQTGETAPPT